MNILMVPSWYKNEQNDIAGSYFREQALSLLKRGHRVFVADATFQRVSNLGSARLFRLKRYDDEGLTTYSLVVLALGLARMPSGGMGIYQHNLHRLYKRMQKDGVKIDLIQAHSFYPAGKGAVWLGKKYGIPVVVTEHNSLVLKKQLPKKRVAMLKETVLSADRFACVSEALKASVAALTDTRKSIEVIPNSVDDRFTYAPKEKTDSFTFVSAGNLIAGKRFDMTISAFARLYADHRNLRLNIVGSGCLERALKEQVLSLGVEDAVRFVGRVPRSEMPRIFQNSDAFVLPSDAETFGVVYVEALACGKPVIGAKNGGAEEIITSENGVLVDKNNEEQLYEAMRFVTENYKRYDAASMAEGCRRTYGETAVTERTIALYQTVLSTFDINS